jgi:hypothetical protein
MDGHNIIFLIVFLSESTSNTLLPLFNNKQQHQKSSHFLKALRNFPISRKKKNPHTLLFPYYYHPNPNTSVIAWCSSWKKSKIYRKLNWKKKNSINIDSIMFIIMFSFLSIFHVLHSLFFFFILFVSLYKFHIIYFGMCVVPMPKRKFYSSSISQGR